MCICNQVVIARKQVIERKQLVRNCIGKNPPQADVHNAQAQYLFTVSISNLGHKMRKFSEFMHFALHSISVCCHLIDL